MGGIPYASGVGLIMYVERCITPDVADGKRNVTYSNLNLFDN